MTASVRLFKGFYSNGIIYMLRSQGNIYFMNRPKLLSVLFLDMDLVFGMRPGLRVVTE